MARRRVKGGTVLGCLRKTAFTEEEAKRAAKAMARYGSPVDAYRCAVGAGDHWHVGRKGARVRT